VDTSGKSARLAQEETPRDFSLIKKLSTIRHERDVAQLFGRFLTASRQRLREVAERLPCAGQSTSGENSAAAAIPSRLLEIKARQGY
jgi:hypothetical protein